MLARANNDVMSRRFQVGHDRTRSVSSCRVCVANWTEHPLFYSPYDMSTPHFNIVTLSHISFIFPTTYACSRAQDCVFHVLLLVLFMILFHRHTSMPLQGSTSQFGENKSPRVSLCEVPSSSAVEEISSHCAARNAQGWHMVYVCGN